MKRSCRAAPARLRLLVFTAVAQAQVAPLEVAVPHRETRHARSEFQGVGRVGGPVPRRRGDGCHHQSADRPFPSPSCCRASASKPSPIRSTSAARWPSRGCLPRSRSDRYSGPAVPMLPQIYLAVAPDSVDALLDKPPAKIRFFSGYSGWAPGQLQGELERGDWLIVDADAKTVFLRDTSRLWQDMVRRARAVRADATR